MEKTIRNRLISLAGVLATAALSKTFRRDNYELVMEAYDELTEILGDWRDEYWPELEALLRTRGTGTEEPDGDA